MTGDEYVALLLDRQSQAPSGPWGPVPLERFVRPGDELLFAPPVETPQPRRETRPRTYWPASYWSEQLDRVEAQMLRLAAPVLGDRAAAGGVGLGVRRSGRVQQVGDRRLASYPELKRQAAGLRWKRDRARAREGATTHEEDR